MGTATPILGSQGSSGGQLGVGDENDRWEPAAVTQLHWDHRILLQDSWRAVQVSCGMNHTAAVVQVLG